MTHGSTASFAAPTSDRTGREYHWPLPTHANQEGGRAPIVGAGAPSRDERAVLARATAEARTALEEAVVATAVAAQRARSVAIALEEALAVLATTEDDGNGAPARVARHADQTGSLSPREREVLALVAEGRSNKAIAEALFVSPNTIKSHVASLLDKLHAETRVQLAAIAARHALV
jgi:DNA-binding NarL/FixJ family response regulator